MAIGTPLNVTPVGSSTGTSTATGTFDTDAGDYLFAWAFTRNNVGFVDPGITDSVGLTWNQIGGDFDGPASNAFVRARLYWADAGAQTGMTVTGTAASSTPHGIHVLRVPMGADPDVSNVSAPATSTTGDPSASVTGTPAAMLSFVVAQAANVFTQPSGWTELGDTSIASSNFRCAAAYDLSSPSTTAAWTSGNVNSVAVALELLESSGAGSQDLTPSLFTNSQTFFGPTITVGAVELTPSLVSNSQTFYGPTVAPGAVTLTPDLFVNDQTFYSPTVAAGGATLSPELLVNDQTFFSATITTGSVDLTPSLFTNAQTFYGPTVSQGGPLQTLTPTLVTSSQTFFGPTVSVGAVTLTPALFTNTQSFYSATVTGGFVPVVTSGPARELRMVPVDAKIKDWPRQLADRVNTHERELLGATPYSVVASGDYTISGYETLIIVDAGAGNVTVTLPALSARTIIVKRVDNTGNTVTIEGDDTIDGAASLALAAQYDVARLVGGAEWHVV